MARDTGQRILCFNRCQPWSKYHGKVIKIKRENALRLINSVCIYHGWAPGQVYFSCSHLYSFASYDPPANTEFLSSDVLLHDRESLWIEAIHTRLHRNNSGIVEIEIPEAQMPRKFTECFRKCSCGLRTNLWKSSKILGIS